MTYLGIDVSKMYFDADFGAAGVKRFDNTTAGIAGFITTVDHGVMCVLEATGPYSWSLVVALHDAGIAVAMENPLKVRRFAQARFQRTKTDRTDACMLTSYGERHTPAAFVPPPSFVLHLRQLLAASDLFVGQRTACTNQLEALTHMPVVDQTAKASLRTQIAAFTRTIAHLAAAMDTLIAKQCPDLAARIRSIPGVGPQTTRQVIALAGDWSRFRTAKAFAAYTGVIPRIYDSGSSVHARGGIVKLGNPRFRAALYMASLSAIRHNPACRDLYARHQQRGKHNMVAIVAVMHKLARQIWAVATRPTPFDPQRSLGNMHAQAA